MCPQAIPWTAYCWDIGSHARKRFGWARVEAFSLEDLPARFRDDALPPLSTGINLDEALNHMEADLRRGCVVSLGVEAPCFLPGTARLAQLGAGRKGEGSRSCFANTGSCVTLTGLQELAYGLVRLRPSLHRVSIDWEARADLGPGDLQVWEAFVSGPAHTPLGRHTDDAMTALLAFLRELADLPYESQERPAFRPGKDLSLVATAAQWAGLPEADERWRQAPRVIRPAEPLFEFQDLLSRYVQRFGHTFRSLTLTPSRRAEACREMVRALLGQRPPLTDLELYGELSSGILL